MRARPTWSFDVVSPAGSGATVGVDSNMAGFDSMNLNSTYASSYLGINNLKLDANL